MYLLSCFLVGTIKSEDEADASASEKEMDEHGETGATKATNKGKRKLQTRKGSKFLHLQTKAASDSESDTGTNICCIISYRMRYFITKLMFPSYLFMCYVFI